MFVLFDSPKMGKLMNPLQTHEKFPEKSIKIPQSHPGFVFCSRVRCCKRQIDGIKCVFDGVFFEKINPYLDLPRGAEWMLRGGVQTAPFGRCWYVCISLKIVVLRP